MRLTQKVHPRYYGFRTWRADLWGDVQRFKYKVRVIGRFRHWVKKFRRNRFYPTLRKRKTFIFKTKKLAQRVRRRRLSRWGKMLRMKQRIRGFYASIKSQQFYRILGVAVRRGQVSNSTRSQLGNLLESRIDNIIYRANFVRSMRSGRQFINHGNVTVNGVVITHPAFNINPHQTVNAFISPNNKIFRCEMRRSVITKRGKWTKFRRVIRNRLKRFRRISRGLKTKRILNLIITKRGKWAKRLHRKLFKKKNFNKLKLMNIKKKKFKITTTFFYNKKLKKFFKKIVSNFKLRILKKHKILLLKNSIKIYNSKQANKHKLYIKLCKLIKNVNLNKTINDKRAFKKIKKYIEAKRVRYVIRFRRMLNRVIRPHKKTRKRYKKFIKRKLSLIHMARRYHFKRGVVPIPRMNQAARSRFKRRKRARYIRLFRRFMTIRRNIFRSRKSRNIFIKYKFNKKLLLNKNCAHPLLLLTIQSIWNSNKTIKLTNKKKIYCYAKKYNTIKNNKIFRSYFAYTLRTKKKKKIYNFLAPKRKFIRIKYLRLCRYFNLIKRNLSMILNIISKIVDKALINSYNFKIFKYRKIIIINVLRLLDVSLYINNKFKKKYKKLERKYIYAKKSLIKQIKKKLSKKRFRRWKKQSFKFNLRRRQKYFKKRNRPKSANATYKTYKVYNKVKQINKKQINIETPN